MVTITKWIKRLTDGSLVFDVSIENGAMIWFSLCSETDCDRFIRTVEMAINSHTLESVVHATGECDA
jgi:hypothetical protein